MKVEDYFNVMGRGWVLVVQGEELSTMKISCGEKIMIGDIEFIIKGVERTMYDNNWWSKRAGLVLRPNNKVPESFEIGQEVEIIKLEQ